MLLRLVYLTVTNTVSLIHLLPMSERDKQVEILALRHQPAVLQRQTAKPPFTHDDRFLLAGLLHHLPLEKLRRLQLLVPSDTILRRHRDLLKRQHATASVPGRWGRPRTIRSIRVLGSGSTKMRGGCDLDNSGVRPQLSDRDARVFDVVMSALPQCARAGVSEPPRSRSSREQNKGGASKRGTHMKLITPSRPTRVLPRPSPIGLWSWTGRYPSRGTDDHVLIPD